MVRNLTAFCEFFQPQQSLCNQWHQAWDTFKSVSLVLCWYWGFFSQFQILIFSSEFLSDLAYSKLHTTKQKFNWLTTLVRLLSSRCNRPFLICSQFHWTRYNKGKKKKSIADLSQAAIFPLYIVTTEQQRDFFLSQGRITNGVLNLRLSPHVFRWALNTF